MREGLLKRKTIFLSGSAANYAPLESKEAKDFIKKLSFELVKNGYKIVNGYGLGVGRYIINGVTDYCYDYKNSQIGNNLKLMPFPLSAINDKKLKETREKYRREMISECGIAIYMFGNKKKDETIVKAFGVKKEFDIAKSEEVINIPLAFTGSMAKELYNGNIDEIKKNIKPEEEKYITQFIDIDTNVDKIIKMLNRISSENKRS